MLLESLENEVVEQYQDYRITKTTKKKPPNVPVFILTKENDLIEVSLLLSDLQKNLDQLNQFDKPKEIVEQFEDYRISKLSKELLGINLSSYVLTKGSDVLGCQNTIYFDLKEHIEAIKEKRQIEKGAFWKT